MRATLRLPFQLALCLYLAVSTLAAGQTPKRQPSPTPFRDLFMELDANNDRVIELAEVPESGRKAFERLLIHGDANYNGKLEAEEFRDLLQKVDWSRAVSPEQLEMRFKNLDRNEDGKLDRQEFQGGPARFSQLDRNGDGFLSRDEIPWLNRNAATGKIEPKKLKP
jgi:Ca2+-binding EF-hand superfamily protein